MASPQSPLADTKYSVPTTHHGPKFTKALKYVVIHLAVCCSGKPRTSHSLGKWSSRSDRPRASWHYNVDSTTITQSLHEGYEGWHTGASETNTRSIGVEMCVYLPSSRDEWMKGYYKQVVDNTARLTADICERKSIPAEALTAQQLRTGQRGVISHNLSRIVYGGTDHTDPGQHFPWSTFMGLVRSYSQKSALKRVEPIDHSVTPCTQVLASMQPYAVVQGFYRMYLKRDGSKDEIGYWLARDRGWDAAVIEEIRLSIAASEEAQSHLH